MIRSRLLKSIVLLFALIFHQTAISQLISGAVCPDFTTNDLQNENFHLYNELDQGKTVIIHVFAAWSPLSWDYHVQGSLQELYSNYGPAGDNSLAVIMIEGESANQTEQITGTGTTGELFSAGDWTSGTEYPICDDADISSLLAVSYFPTVYMICPDRRIFEIGAIGVEEISAIIDQQNCSPVTTSRDAALLAINKIGGDCINTLHEFEAIIQNRGLEPMTSASISAGDWFDYEWTGSLETYEFDTVSIGAIELTVGDTVLFLISLDDDGNLLNDSIESFAGTTTSSTHIRVQLRTDNWPAETSWIIRDEEGTTVAQSESYATMTNQTITRDIYLSGTGCYSFTLFDSDGDGLNASEWGGTDGFCRVYGVDGAGLPMRFIYDYNGNYNLTEETSDFRVNEVVGIQELSTVNELTIYPNPSTNILNIAYSLVNAESLSFQLYNSLGSMVFSSVKGVQSAGKYVEPVDVSRMSSGFYLLQILNQQGVLTTMKITITEQ